MSEFSPLSDQTVSADSLPPRTSWLMPGPVSWGLKQWQRLAAQQRQASGVESLCVTGTPSDPLPDPEIWTDSVPGKQLSRMLGRSYDRVILDWRHDWQINHLSQAAGMLRAGGQLIILLAEPSHRAACYSWHRHGGNSVYFPWWYQRMVDSGAQVCTPEMTESHFPRLPDSTPSPHLSPDSEGQKVTRVLRPLTPDQHHAVRAVAGITSGSALVMCAERGHGKTLTLVLGVRALLERAQPVVITAGLTEHLKVLDYWLAQALTAEQLAGVRCVPWQQLKDYQLDDKTVLVDEAAVLGVPRLQWLKGQAPRLVLATTTAGYEGSGLGFLLRFLPWLQSRASVQMLPLNQPIRWAQNDPVARQLRIALLYPELEYHRPESRDPRELPQTIPQSVPELIDPIELLEDAQLRAEWVSLLMESHYQTRPDDLRQCLDNPDASMWGVRSGARLVGLLVALEEPPLSEDLADAVWHGVRRPPDQLAKQSLVGQLGHRAAASWHGARIWRLVVHPNWRRQGVAAALVQALSARLQAAGYDYVATSFGLTDDLWAFWSALAWQPVRLGHRPDAASGEQSLLAIRPLQSEVGQWVNQAGTALGESILLLPESARMLNNPALLLALARTLSPPPLSRFEQARLNHWCHSHQPEESAPLLLARALWLAVRKAKSHPLPPETLLQSWVCRLWCHDSWADIQAAMRLHDRKAAQSQLRQFLLTTLLD